LPQAIPINTQAGSYLIAADQPPGENETVTLDLVVGPSPMWAVIYNDDEGQPGEIVGRVWLGPGIHRQVSIEVNPSQAGETLHAVLHQDGGELEAFDFPDGADVPLIRNGAWVAVSFRVQELLDANP
jgi:hypothetical protein